MKNIIFRLHKIVHSHNVTTNAKTMLFFNSKNNGNFSIRFWRQYVSLFTSITANWVFPKFKLSRQFKKICLILPNSFKIKI